MSKKYNPNNKENEKNLKEPTKDQINNPDNWFDLGVYMNDNAENFEKAIFIYNKALELYNLNPTLYQKKIELTKSNLSLSLLNLGKQYLIEKKPKLALDYFQESILLAPHEPYSYYYAGCVCSELSNHFFKENDKQQAKNHLDTAIKYLTIAINRYNPNDNGRLKRARETISDVYTKKGFILYHQQQYDEAGVLYQTALEHNPRNPTAFYHLGVSYTHLGHHEEAFKCFEKVISIESEKYNYIDKEILFDLQMKDNKDLLGQALNQKDICYKISKEQKFTSNIPLKYITIGGIDYLKCGKLEKNNNINKQKLELIDFPSSCLDSKLEQSLENLSMCNFNQEISQPKKQTKNSFEWYIKEIEKKLEPYSRDIHQKTLCNTIMHDFLTCVKASTPEKALNNLRSCYTNIPKKFMTLDNYLKIIEIFEDTSSNSPVQELIGYYRDYKCEEAIDKAINHYNSEVGEYIKNNPFTSSITMRKTLPQNVMFR